MNTWILIVTLYAYHGHAVTTAEYNSKESCMVAANAYLKHASPKVGAASAGTVSAICTKK